MEKTSVIKNTKIPYERIYKKYGENITPEILSQQANISLLHARTYIYIRKRGFNSKQEYEKYLENKRQQSQINFILSNLIEIRLYVLGKTKTQLARELGVTRGAVSRYTCGKTLPRKSLHLKLFRSLELSPKTLEYLLR